MGPHYEINEETGMLEWHDESTGWKTMSRELTAEEHATLDALQVKLWAEWRAALEAMARAGGEEGK